MSHSVKRQRESPEKEAARLEKGKAQIIDYRALTEDVLARVIPFFQSPPETFSEPTMTCPNPHLI
jgi:hypothetical protein